jgi:tetratricopeptide (TPR) repeat protein
MKTKISNVFIIVVFLYLTNTNTEAAERNNSTCGIEPGKPLTNSYGPFDFTNPSHAPRLPIVLGAHFTSQVERLERGNTGSILSDIDYTLRAIPNYHRALNAVSLYELRQKEQLQGVKRFYTAECYFKRALYFQPNDAATRMLFAIHLHKLQRFNEAEALYAQALSLSPNNSEINYNIALLYVDTNRISLAKKHAKVAYDGGYPLLGLKNRINRAEQQSQ